MRASEGLALELPAPLPSSGRTDAVSEALVSAFIADRRNGQPHIRRVADGKTASEASCSAEYLRIVSVALRQVHFIHDLAASTGQQSLKRLREAGPIVSRGRAAKKDSVRQSADQNAA